MYKREIFNILYNRLTDTRRFIQVVAGPRQVGKTTMVQQIMTALPFHAIYATADDPSLNPQLWITQQWHLARSALKTQKECVLILDEIQKLKDWSSIVKQLWDEDTHTHTPLKVVLLGSAPLLIQQGLTESLAGRFEKIIATHWSYPEMKAAFNWTLDQYIYFGGYPGSAALIKDEKRWRQYITDSLIETTLTRDILLLNTVNKPALLKRLFDLSCHYSSKILSYNKMLGQLQDAGNTTTLSHYLDLLTAAGMVTGLEKYANEAVRKRSSSPKLQVFNTAFISALTSQHFHHTQQDHEVWGYLVESAVGAYLINSALREGMKVYYWREDNLEVDFVLEWQRNIIAIEVKSSMAKPNQPGLARFTENFPTVTSLVVGGQNLSLETFLSTPVTTWFEGN